MNTGFSALTAIKLSAAVVLMTSSIVGGNTSNVEKFPLMEGGQGEGTCLFLKNY